MNPYSNTTVSPMAKPISGMSSFGSTAGARPGLLSATATPRPAMTKPTTGPGMAMFNQPKPAATLGSALGATGTQQQPSMSGVAPAALVQRRPAVAQQPGLGAIYGQAAQPNVGGAYEQMAARMNQQRNQQNLLASLYGGSGGGGGLADFMRRVGGVGGFLGAR